jgi:2-methylcitrate dehydratase MmgE/PrpD-like protein
MRGLGHARPYALAVTDGDRYRLALLDWLACAARGMREQLAQAARSAADGLGDRVVAAGCAGHVLDYDDTYAPGLVHASAPVAPVALLLAAQRDLTLEAVLAAYAAGFEATAALARAVIRLCTSEGGTQPRSVGPSAQPSPHRGSSRWTRSANAPPQGWHCCAPVGCRQRSAQTARRSRSDSRPPQGCKRCGCLPPGHI